jgi:glycine oxidase
MALTWWPEQIAILKQQTEQDIHYGMAGSVVVAHDLDVSSLHHFEQTLRAKIPDRSDGVKHIDREQLRDLEPELAERYNSGLFLADEGYLDNEALLSALETAITQLGGEWFEYCEVLSAEPNRLVLEDKTQEFDWVVDCRGLGAKKQLPGLRGVRGEVLWVHAPEVNLRRPVRLMHPRYKLYISPRPGNRYVIGATEIESESMQPVTVRSTLELMSALYSVHSGFAEACLLHAFAHCRPAMPDNLPVLKCETGLLTVNGLYRHGYLLSPQLVEQALAVFAEQTANSIAV